jgi:hypothetical protein
MYFLLYIACNNVDIEVYRRWSIILEVYNILFFFNTYIVLID